MVTLMSCFVHCEFTNWIKTKAVKDISTQFSILERELKSSSATAQNSANPSNTNTYRDYEIEISWHQLAGCISLIYHIPGSLSLAYFFIQTDSTRHISCTLLFFFLVLANISQIFSLTAWRKSIFFLHSNVNHARDAFYCSNGFRDWDQVEMARRSCCSATTKVWIQLEALRVQWSVPTRSGKM